MEKESSYSGLAIASFVLGILSVLMGFIPVFGWALIILTLIFGFISLSQIRKNNHLRGKGLAITGLVLGFIAVLISLVLFIAIISLFSYAVGNSTVYEGAGEILMLNEKCDSDPVMEPISCDALTGEVVVRLNGYYEEDKIYSRVFLEGGAEAFSDLEVDLPLQAGEIIVIPAPEGGLASNANYVRIQYNLCGGAGCVGCSETVFCE
jgi:hypothetical protein